MRTRTLFLGPLLAGVALLGCSSASSPDASSPSPAPSAASAEDVATDDGIVARALVPDVAVYATPGDVEPARLVPGRTAFGFPQTFLVQHTNDEFLEVVVAGRPNGGTGWIRSSDVELSRVDHELHVDLAARTLTWLDDDGIVLTTPVAVGSDEYPTPVGTFFVTDLLDTTDDSGAYGPFAIGLSGRSEILTEFAGGDGQVGIHGTDDPSSIGQAASHGCIRIPNDIITQLASALPLGTLVIVT